MEFVSQFFDPVPENVYALLADSGCRFGDEVPGAYVRHFEERGRVMWQIKSSRNGPTLCTVSKGTFGEFANRMTEMLHALASRGLSKPGLEFLKVFFLSPAEKSQ